MLKQIINELLSKSNPEKATLLSGFFKTGKGEYGEGDKFLGLTVPELRTISRKYYKEVNLKDIQNLLKDKYHEIRMTAIFLLILKNEKADEKIKKKYFDFYLKKHTTFLT